MCENGNRFLGDRDVETILEYTDTRYNFRRQPVFTAESPNGRRRALIFCDRVRTEGDQVRLYAYCGTPLLEAETCDLSNRLVSLFDREGFAYRSDAEGEPGAIGHVRYKENYARVGESGHLYLGDSGVKEGKFRLTGFFENADSAKKFLLSLTNEQGNLNSGLTLASKLERVRELLRDPN